MRLRFLTVLLLVASACTYTFPPPVLPAGSGGGGQMYGAAVQHYSPSIETDALQVNGKSKMLLPPSSQPSIASQGNVVVTDNSTSYPVLNSIITTLPSISTNQPYPATEWYNSRAPLNQKVWAAIGQDNGILGFFGFHDDGTNWQEYLKIDPFVDNEVSTALPTGTESGTLFSRSGYGAPAIEWLQSDATVDTGKWVMQSAGAASTTPYLYLSAMNDSQSALSPLMGFSRSGATASNVWVHNVLQLGTTDISTADTGIARNAAGVVEADTGVAGTLGTFRASTFDSATGNITLIGLGDTGIPVTIANYTGLSATTPIVAFNNGTQKAVIVGAGEYIPPTAHLSVFSTCASGIEGAHAVQDDAAVACVAGVLAAAGGSTHCEIVCHDKAGTGYEWERSGQ